jgi:hypothetical protein
MSAAIIGLLGVILGSVITVAKDWVAYIFGRKSNGRYAAVRIISVLDEYVQKCVAVVSDDGTAEGRPAGRTEHGEEYYDPQVECPEPPVFASDIDWKSISFKLMHRALTLPNTARETDRYIHASAENLSPADYDELIEARQEGYASLGLEALAIVRELRKEFGLPPIPTKVWNLDWDAQKFLQGKRDEIEKRREVRASSYAMMAEPVESKEG